MRIGMLSAAAVLLTSCASMEVVPLDVKANKAEPGAVQGFRIPRMTPYLVVAQLPGKTTSVTPTAGGAAVAGKQVAAGLPAPPPGGGLVPGAPVAAGPHGPGAADAGTTADASTPAATPGTGSDTSFVAQTDTFVMKIVYLPDYSHAVAVRVKSGIFGASSLQLSFQNGMLTAVGGKVDNTKAGDVAVAALQAITSIATGGASKAAAAPGAAPGGGEKAISKPDGPPLRPGIYAFVPVSSRSPLGICTVAYFTPEGVQSPADTDTNRCATSPAVTAQIAGHVGN